ncbi:MAG: DUF3990 domain-containing protein [Bacteroidales bacterium]|nr:DUF3990 domain-containing protein [Bacteroidales bacterium]
MILYHGSNVAINQIDLNASRPGKDFGRGFYLSAEKEQAVELAKSKVAFLGGEPIVTAFEFDESVLTSGLLKVKTFEGYSEEWAKFVYENRENFSDAQLHDFDIIYGPIANDKVGAQIRAFKGGNITLEELKKRIEFIKGITYQYFFGTEAAIKTLRKI